MTAVHGIVMVILIGILLLHSATFIINNAATGLPALQYKLMFYPRHVFDVYTGAITAYALSEDSYPSPNCPANYSCCVYLIFCFLPPVSPLLPTLKPPQITQFCHQLLCILSRPSARSAEQRVACVAILFAMPHKAP